MGAKKQSSPGKLLDENYSIDGRNSVFVNRVRSCVNVSSEAPFKISQLENLYEQLNRVVENLVKRIADQERRLNKISQSGIVMEHYGRPSNSSQEVTVRKKISPSALAFSNLTTSP